MPGRQLGHLAAAAHAAEKATEAAHATTAAAHHGIGHLHHGTLVFHHLLHHLELLQKLVHLHHGATGAVADALAALAVDDFRALSVLSASSRG
jgi:hypothetical protein